MRHNPVRTNFLENTGAYLWQTAAWANNNCPTREQPAELKRAHPPKVQNAFTVWATKIDSGSIVQWSAQTHVTLDVRSPILSRRGSTVAVAVNTKAQSFIEVAPDIAELLKSPTCLGEISELVDYGNEPNIADAVVSLVRHGLLDMTPRPNIPLWGIRRESFVDITAGEDDVMFISNMLTGRFLRCDTETANIIDSLWEPAPVTEPLNDSLRTLVEAGVLRLVGEL